jgi:hypothetical protein
MTLSTFSVFLIFTHYYISFGFSHVCPINAVFFKDITDREILSQKTQHHRSLSIGTSSYLWYVRILKAV